MSEQPLATKLSIAEIYQATMRHNSLSEGQFGRLYGIKKPTLKEWLDYTAESKVKNIGVDNG